MLWRPELFAELDADKIILRYLYTPAEAGIHHALIGNSLPLADNKPDSRLIQAIKAGLGDIDEFIVR